MTQSENLILKAINDKILLIGYSVVRIKLKEPRTCAIFVEDSDSKPFQLCAYMKIDCNKCREDIANGVEEIFKRRVRGEN